MRFKRRIKLEKGQLDMTPLIDVVFQLLLFFMLSSSFILQPGIRVKLSKAKTSRITYDKMDIVTVSKNHLIFFNERPVSAEQLNQHLHQIADHDGLVLIKADRHAHFDIVVQVWDMCRQAGISDLNIATDPKESSE